MQDSRFSVDSCTASFKVSIVMGKCRSDYSTLFAPFPGFKRIAKADYSARVRNWNSLLNVNPSMAAKGNS